MDPARQATAKEYARRRRWLLLVDLAVNAAWLAAWLALGWGPSVERSIALWTTNPWLVVLLFGAVFFLSFHYRTVFE